MTTSPSKQDKNKGAVKTSSGLLLFPNHIQIPGNSKVGTQNLTIREQVMTRYREFVQCWAEAVSFAAQAPNLTFSQLWITNEGFRAAMVEAMEAVGVDEPENILPSHLQELLMICTVEGEGDVRPALFRLHSDAPDPKILGELLKTPQKTPDSRKLESPKSSRWSIFARSS